MYIQIITPLTVKFITVSSQRTDCKWPRGPSKKGYQDWPRSYVCTKFKDPNAILDHRQIRIPFKVNSHYQVEIQLYGLISVCSVHTNSLQKMRVPLVWIWQDVTPGSKPLSHEGVAILKYYNFEDEIFCNLSQMKKKYLF